MKILTHTNPDLDAVCSCWLICRFLPGWQKAEVGFIKSGKFNGADDSDEEVLVVDTGMGLSLIHI